MNHLLDNDGQATPAGPAAATLLPMSDRIKRPRIGFLGVGWIGRHRMQAVVDSGLADVVAVADQSPEAVAEAQTIAPGSAAAVGLDGLLDSDLDALVIATPSALHAQQATAALQQGLAVFCQKPLARTAAETRQIVTAAKRADRLLAVDFSYRCVAGVPEMRRLLHGGAIGQVFAIDLVFHNAYGPDKPWFYDPSLSGGGCVIDLGVHLVDLALWLLDYPAVADVSSQLYQAGQPLATPADAVEDFAVAQFQLASGAVARLTCSWRLSAGCDAVIEATVNGTAGALSLRNVNGSFYDFSVEHRQGTSRSALSMPPDDWGGRAIVDWVRQLQHDRGYDPAAERLLDVASVVDRIYDR